VPCINIRTGGRSTEVLGKVKKNVSWTLLYKTYEVWYTGVQIAILRDVEELTYYGKINKAMFFYPKLS
jgi:hypothetical protein